MMEHDRLIAALKKTIKTGINGNGEVELYFPYPLHIPKSDPQWKPQVFEYSASDIDEAFSAFDETELAKIITLQLSCNKIKKLPEQVRRLKNMAELTLFITDIKRLPKWFSELTNLKRVNVETYNKSLIRNFEPVLKLPALTELFIDSPNNDELPPLIGECTALTKLGLRFGFGAVPPCLRNMPSLKLLHLECGGFTALPEWFGELSALETLCIKDTELLELPPSFANLTSLKTLILDSNAITELPDYIGNLVTLSTLDLTRTQITTLPDTLAKCVSLKTLKLGMSAINKVPECVRHLPLLERLDLGATKINELPPWLENIKTLKHLDIGNTEIKTIPECLLQQAEHGKLILKMGNILIS
jgi:Leucine-rich repeat (LRR) protein